MIDIEINPYNESYVKLVVKELATAQEIDDFFSFKIPDYYFMKKRGDKRLKYWDGTIHLFKKKQKILYKGLVPYVLKFAKDRNLKVENNIGNFQNNYTEQDVSEFLKKIKTKLDARDYQIHNILHCINKKRAVILSATSSGKSFSIYCVLRFLNKKSILVVPTTHLVEQMYKDFKEYSKYDDSWNVDEQCSKIMAGYSKENLNQYVITTWQSIYNLPQEWFADYEVAIVDEAHEAKAKSLSTVMENCVNADYRYGFTGTLDDIQVHKLVLEGLFGPVELIITAKEMIDRGYGAQLDIRCLILNYSEKDLAEFKKFKIKKDKKPPGYFDEIGYLIQHPRRNKYIRQLSYVLKGNVLILYQYVEKHGEILYKLLQEEAEKYNKKVYFIHGEISTEEREQIRESVEKDNNAIIVASYGTYRRGVNIVNLHNIIFGSPAKNRIKVLQSIGRGLRKGGSKERCILFDIADNLTKKGSSKFNFSLKHAYHRINTYNEEQFNYKIKKVELYETK